MFHFQKKSGFEVLPLFIFETTYGVLEMGFMRVINIPKPCI